MTVRTNVAIGGSNTVVLQEAISAYTDEAYTNAKKLTGTGIVGSNPSVNKDTETFIGQLRWHKPLNPTVNVVSLTNAANGTKTNYSSDYLNYVKTVRAHGAEKINMQSVVTQEDGLAKIGRDFSETKAQDIHDAMLSVLKGVAISEALNGAASGQGATGTGGQTFANDPTDRKYGFYVDLGNSTGPVVAATSAVQGAARATGLLDAFGAAFKDYEPDYAYLVVSPEVLASFRSANLVDQDRVTEGKVDFSTIFGGKFRLIPTRANQAFSSAELAKLNTGAGVDIVGTKTSFIVLPGALAFETLDVPEEVEITRDGNSYNGGGSSTIWYRWGYILAPVGYNWAGSQDLFPTNAQYKGVSKIDGTFAALTDALGDTGNNLTNNATPASATAWVKGVWERKSSSALNLGILPVFHG